MIPRPSRLSLLACALPIFACSGCGATGDRTELVVSPFHHNRHNAIVRIRQPERRVALTFDDGPSAVATPKLLHLLARKGVPATFFVIGRRALSHPGLIELERNLGHEVENHTQTHPNLTRLSRSEISREVERGASAIEATGAPAPRLFRPPLGAFDERVGAQVAANRELMIGWDLPLDRFLQGRDTVEAARALAAQLRRGSIVLIHAERPGNNDRTLRAVAALIDELRGRGYEPVTVRQLLDGRD